MAAERVMSFHLGRGASNHFLGSRGMVERALREPAIATSAVIRREKVSAFGRELELDLIHEAGDVRLYRFAEGIEAARAAVAELGTVEFGADNISVNPIEV